MPIIVSQNGKNAQKVDSTPFGLEDRLQEYILDNPNSIPLYEIRDDIELVLLSREFQTNSGPIDAIGVDAEGNLYLIETKLYKNPDKRTVVAQVMDYGAALWKHLTNFEDFMMMLNKHSQSNFQCSATEKIQTYFNLTDETTEKVLERMRNNLDEGKFKFVILMDSLDDRLKDLILYINQNSKFDIYGVELDYYQHESFEITIPKLFGAEVKKSIGATTSDTVVYTQDDLISAYASIGFEDKIREILQTYDQINQGSYPVKNVTANKSAKSINLYFNLPATDSFKDLAISIGVMRGKPLDTLDLWCYSPEQQDQLIEAIQNVLGIPATKLVPESNYGRIGQWPLKDFSQEKLLKLFESLA